MSGRRFQIVLASGLAAIAAGCGGQESGTAERLPEGLFLTGDFGNPQVWMRVTTNEVVFVANDGEPARPAAPIDGDTVRFDGDPRCRAASGEPVAGSYRLRPNRNPEHGEASKLHLEPLADECDERREMLAHRRWRTWEEEMQSMKTPPAAVTLFRGSRR